jgi:hypothetical protein
MFHHASAEIHLDVTLMSYRDCDLHGSTASTAMRERPHQSHKFVSDAQSVIQQATSVVFRVNEPSRSYVQWTHDNCRIISR